MKIVKNKDDLVSVDELVKYFKDYIIATKVNDKIYILMRTKDSCHLKSLRDSSVLNQYPNLSVAVRRLNLDHLKAFKTNKEFGEWLIKQ